MALFRSFNEIVNSMRERLRLTQPNLDTKVGTVSRDLFIDAQAEQIEKLHKAMLLVSEKQSPASASGTDLDKWARNFGISRKGGSPANGLVVFTTNELNSDVAIPANTIVTAKSGATFRTIGNYTMSVSEKNRYSAIASRLRRLLNLAGISDQYALEIPVQATAAGRSGNIAPYQIISSNVRDGLKVINLTSFANGDNSESDAAFRSRVFATFSGANTGTASGYRNAALSITGVLDVLIVEPGNSLMLRDGTETIQINDGTFRILNSGTGGKVDLYILGKQLVDNSESYIYVDKSGNGDPTDERNNYVPGISFLDNTLTSEERRLAAFNDGQIPLQPIDNIISVSGSLSGILSPKTVDSDGNVSGNYELVRDTNADTGGSPFGYDYIKFISNKKDVLSEVIIKKDLNSVDPLRFTDISTVSDVFQDRQILNENSKVLATERSIVYLNHSPIVNVSRIVNKTTGEVYVIESQNVDEVTGLNYDGFIEISGKTLPSTADILSTDYIWRQFYDPYIDFNGSPAAQSFSDISVVDSIDWGVSSGIFEEESLITQSDDEIELQIQTDYNISRVLSVYSKTQVSAQTTNLTNFEGETVLGMLLQNSDDSISNIISIKTDGLEIWNTNNADGVFSVRTIYLPTDAAVTNGATCTIEYNKIEYFNIENTDGTFSNNIITLPSQDILEGEAVYDSLEEIFLTSSEIYVKYVASLNYLIPSTSLTLLPIIGSSGDNQLSDSSLATITSSNQPIFYNDDLSLITRFGPSKLSCSVSGIIKAGKIKISGTTFKRMVLNIESGVALNNLLVDIKNPVLEQLGLSSLTSNIGLARIENVQIDDGSKYDIVGYSILNNEYDLTYSVQNSNLSQLSFYLPGTSTNLSLSPTSSQSLLITCLIYIKNDFEELYFPQDQTIYTEKTFAIIDRISISSGFRSSVGSITGNIRIGFANQPEVGISYLSNYSFTSPKEGERITVRYNVNNLIADVTRAVEEVRPITADVLIKEAFEISVDVQGEILINEDSEDSETQILENVTNAVINLLNTNTLGSIIDYSDIINIATTIPGVDSVNISLFNESGEQGRRTFIKSLDNQTIIAGSVIFESIPRKDFRIS